MHNERLNFLEKILGWLLNNNSYDIHLNEEAGI